MPGARRPMVAHSRSMKELLRLALLIAAQPGHVLITGETGTGKTSLAHFIHDNSPRRRCPWVHINAAQIRGNATGYLNGWVKGAFTGATKDHKGYICQADTGTAFLDEFGEMPDESQAQLLLTIEQQKVRPLGALCDVDINVRFITATHSHHKMRPDIIERLGVFRLHIPPLRKRLDDVPGLANHILMNRALVPAPPQETGPCWELSPEAVDMLCAYQWPCNVRELRNVIQRATAVPASEKRNVIGAKDIALSFPQDDARSSVLTPRATLVTPQQVLAALPMDFQRAMLRVVFCHRRLRWALERGRVGKSWTRAEYQLATDCRRRTAQEDMGILKALRLAVCTGLGRDAHYNWIGPTLARGAV